MTKKSAICHAIITSIINPEILAELPTEMTGYQRMMFGLKFRYDQVWFTMGSPTEPMLQEEQLLAALQQHETSLPDGILTINGSDRCRYIPHLILDICEDSFAPDQKALLDFLRQHYVVIPQRIAGRLSRVLLCRKDLAMPVGWQISISDVNYDRSEFDHVRGLLSQYRLWAVPIPLVVIDSARGVSF